MVSHHWYRYTLHILRIYLLFGTMGSVWCIIYLFISDLTGQETSLDTLEATSRMLVQSGLRIRTRRTYSSAQRCYLRFCDDHGLVPIPCSEDTMLLFIAYLHTNNCKSSTIRVYKAAVRSLHIEEGYGDPTEKFLRMKQALRGIDVISDNPVKKFPITLDILCKLINILCDTVSDKMLAAAFTLAYYGCLRASEIAIEGKFDPRYNLQVSDVSFSHIRDDSVTTMSVRIKTSKTDKTSKGFDVVIACVPHTTCAPCAMTRFLNTLPPNSDRRLPLFRTLNGTLLTKSLYRKQIKLYMSALGYQSEQFSGHSFRSGCTTDAASAGFMDWELKLLGRWSSDAYQGYIRTPRHMLANFATRLSQHQAGISSQHHQQLTNNQFG